MRRVPRAVPVRHPRAPTALPAALRYMRTLWRNARIATCDEAVAACIGAAQWSRATTRSMGGRRTRTCRPASRPTAPSNSPAAGSRPGSIDCHTHLVFAGQRAAEFARRTAGTSYADIAREGGGILTPCARRARPSEELARGERGRGSQRCCRKASRRSRSSRATGSTSTSKRRMLRGATARAGHAGDGLDQPARRARPAAGVRRARGRLHRRDLRRLAAAAGRGQPLHGGDQSPDSARRPARRQRRRLLRGHRLLAPHSAIDCSPQRARTACPCACTRSSSRTSAAARLAARHGALSCDHLEYAHEDDALRWRARAPSP